MFSFFREHALYGMAGLRMLSGLIEFSAGLLMLYFGTLQRAVMINAGLSLVGPTVLVLVTAIGVVGMADQMEYSKLFFVVAGVGLILWGVRG